MRQEPVLFCIHFCFKNDSVEQSRNPRMVVVIICMQHFSVMLQTVSSVSEICLVDFRTKCSRTSLACNENSSCGGVTTSRGGRQLQQLHVRLKRAAELSRAWDDVARLRVVGVTVDAAAGVRKLSCDATGYSYCCWFLYIRNASQIDTQEAQLTPRHRASTLYVSQLRSCQRLNNVTENIIWKSMHDLLHTSLSYRCKSSSSAVADGTAQRAINRAWRSLWQTSGRLSQVLSTSRINDDQVYVYHALSVHLCRPKLFTHKMAANTSWYIHVSWGCLFIRFDLFTLLHGCFIEFR